MKKFEGISEELDVLKASGPTYAFLCKPLINILNQMDVSSDIFLKFQADYLRKLTESYACDCKAVQVLKLTRLGLPFGLISASGIDILSEVFFRKGLDTVVKRKILLVKEKARIELDHNTARVMFGVPDVTNTLKEGEVFFQYSDEENPSKPPTAFEGEVLITKFPCIHPGDVRKFQAMKFVGTIKGLTNLIDVLVFPTCGTRPHSNEMSGSDMDGDEYFITWDPKLIFPRPNTNAMDYPDTKAENLNRPVEVLDMLEFYCRFSRDSGIGRISAAHLAISDRKGIFNQVCESLAEKASIALDFAKTGQSVKLLHSERPEIYPDFMDKDDKPMYQSSHALGLMHREIVDFRDFLDDIPGQEQEGNSNVRLLTVQGHERYEQSARNAYRTYASAIQHLQKMHGIDDEIGLVYDCFVKGQKYLCGRNENDSVHEVCHRSVNNIMRQLSDQFYEEFSHIPEDQRTQSPHCQAKASAWYLVTRELNRGRNQKYYLLPWIISPVLIEIAHTNRPPNFRHMCASSPPISSNEIAGDTLVQLWDGSSEDLKQRKILNDLNLWFEDLQNNGKFDGVDADEQQLFEAKNILRDSVVNILSQVPIETLSYSESYVLVMKRLYHCFDMYSSFSGIYSYLRILVLFSLFRYYRTRETKNLGKILLGDGTEVLHTFSLSMRDGQFREMVSRTNSPLKIRLKQVVGGNEIKEMVAKIHESSHHLNDLCLVSVSGTKGAIWKLKNAITKTTFYSDILNPNFGLL